MLFRGTSFLFTLVNGDICILDLRASYRDIFFSMKGLLFGALALGAAAIDYPAYNFSVPVDHFHNESRYAPHSDESFNLRYWFDASNYKPGGPVIVLQSGETSGVGRLPFLEKGICSPN